MNANVRRQLVVDPEDPFGELRVKDRQMAIDGEVVSHSRPTSDLAEAFATVWRQKWAFVLVTAVIFTALAAMIVRLPSHYVAEAQVLISDQGALAIAPTARGVSATGEQVLGTQRQILASRALIYRILDRLPPDVADSYNVVAPPGLLDRVVLAISDLFGASGGGTGPSAAAPEDLSAEPTSSDTIRERQYNAIVGNLSTAVIPDTNVISITYQESRPEVAVFIVNEIAREYELFTAERRQQNGDESLTWIRDEVQKLRDRVQTGEQQIAAYRSAAASGSAQSANDFSGQIDEMGLQITRARQQVARYEALLDAIDQGGADALASGLPGSDFHSQILDGLVDREAELAAEMASIAEDIGPQHPTYQTAQSALGQVRTSINREVARIRTGIETELAQSRTQLASLLSEMTALTRERAELETSELSIQDIERQVEADRASLEQLYMLTSQVNLTGTAQGVNAEVLSEAVDVSGSPRPNKKLLLMAGLMLSGILSLIIVFVLDFSRKAVSRIDHLGQIGFGRYVGRISNFGTMSERRLVDRLQQRRRARSVAGIVDQAEQILLRLDEEHRQDETLAILVTSQSRGEGKSTLALLLAHAAARANHRTLLIDLDLRASSLFKLWSNSEQGGIGVGDLAADPETSESLALVHTGLGFDYIGPGNCVGSPTGVVKRCIASKAFRGLVGNYDVVIMDSAPVGPVADSQPLIGLADCVVLPARAGKTRVSAIARLAEEMPRAALRKVRFVLNGAGRRQARYADQYP